MWNTRSTFPPPPAPARNKALNKRKALAGSSGGGLAFFIPALFLFRPAPAFKTLKSLPPASRPLPPASAPAAPLLYPFQPGAALAPPWPLSLQQALLSLLTPLAPASALHFRPGPPLPPRPSAPAPALHSRLGPPLPPRPCTLASALRSRLGPPLPPWPSAPALALRSRLGPPLPPQPLAPALATRSRLGSPLSSRPSTSALPAHSSPNVPRGTFGEPFSPWKTANFLFCLLA